LPKGYTGKRVHVDLSKGKVRVLKLEEGFCRTYLGGKGFAAKILYEETRRGINPLSPDNLLVFAVGPLVGTAAPGANRLVACFKSPLTGIWGESYCGGELGTQLKWAGIDVLTVAGRSSKPVYLMVDDGAVELKDASHLWGKDSYEAERILIEEAGREFQFATIGPAGENLVKFACVTHARGRQLGRCGAGAVFGSKNLKAIAVRGSRLPEVADVEALAGFRWKIFKAVREKLQSLSTYGTPAIAVLVNKAGVLPTRNWNEGFYEKLEEISPEVFKDRFYTRRRACYGCPVACRHISEVAEGVYAGVRVEGPEYETLFAWGSLCDIESPGALVKVNEVCDRLGLDTVTAGNVLAFAMECYERKIIDSKKTGGIKLEFGNVDEALRMLREIAYRKGFGKLLSEGVRKASKKLGKTAEKLAVHVKGLEPPGYDPRGLKAMALAYAVSCRGACHMRSLAYRPNLTGKHPFNPEKTVDRLSYDGQPAMVVELEDFYAVVDSMIYCHFFCFPVIGLVLWRELEEVYRIVTGVKADVSTLRKAGARINSLIRLYNVREKAPSDMVYPEKWLKKKLKGGASAGQVVSGKKLKRMLAEYYRLRGWTRTGRPKKEQALQP